jgi:hypothetical protein
MTKRSTLFWQTIAVMALLFSLAAAIQTGRNASAQGIDILHSKWLSIFLAISALGAGALAFLFLSGLPAGRKVLEMADRLAGLPPAWRIAGVVGFLLLLPVYASIISRPSYIQYLDGIWMRAFLCALLWLGGMLLLKLGRKELPWRCALGGSVVVQAVVYSFLANLSFVSNYPFSQGWSEFSRTYGASLYSSEQFYGARLPLPVLNPAYHLMLTVPFWFGVPPLWVHRLWDVLLQVGLTAGLALVFAKRLKLQDRALTWFVTGWAFLFLMQGPIQAPQLVCALITLAGVAPGRFWRTTLVVALASLWAGWCRINWFPFPAALAAVLYFLEFPASGRRSNALWNPALWLLLGTGVAFGSNLLYMIISGNGLAGNFTSSLTSDLLWYRLLPNPTYPHGILPDLLLVSAAPILMIVLALHRGNDAVRPLPLAGIFSILAVFLLGGLLVSVKIGGGADLHNLDAFLVLLMVVSGQLYAGRVASAAAPGRPVFLENILLPILILLIPAWMAIQGNLSFQTWSKEKETLALETIREVAGTMDSQGGRVLFISQRQLFLFDDLDVRLIPEYDQVTIMEMVMSHNQAYLDAFRADLRARRFALIILDPQEIQYYGRTRAFGEENDLWVREISVPLLCYYKAGVTFDPFPVTLYVPREQSCE